MPRTFSTLLICLFFLLLAACKTDDQDLLFQALPAESALVLECSDLSATLREISDHGPAQARQLLQLSVWQQARKDLQQAQTALSNYGKSELILGKQQLLISWTLAPEDSLHPLFICHIADSKALEQQLESCKPNVQTAHFQQYTVFQTKEGLCFSCSGNLLVCSKKRSLIEAAWVQLGHPAGTRWPIAARQEGGIHVFLRPQQCMRYAQKPVPAAVSGIASAFGEILRLDWSAKKLQFSVVSDEDGLGLPADSVLKKELAQLIPASVQGYQAIDLNKARIGAEFDRVLRPAFAGSGVLLLPGIDKTWPVYIFQIKDPALFEQNMRAYGADFGILKQYDYQIFSITKYAAAAIYPQANGPVNVCVATIGDYAVLAADEADLEALIDQYIVNETLSADIHLLGLVSARPAPQFPMLYVPGKDMATFFGAFDKQSSDYAIWESFGMLGFFTQDSQQGSNSGIIASASGAATPAQIPNVLWRTVLSAPAITRPFVLYRDSARSKGLILIQDSRFRLHCLDFEGKQRWQKPLEGALQSDIQGTCDKKGVLTFYMNTLTQVLVLNEAGEDLNGFPLKLQADACNGLTVVNFDGQNDIALFFACKNGNVYGYDRFARPLAAWNGMGFPAPVSSPIRHFQANNKDFIGILTQTGQLYLYGRNGGLRYEAKQYPGRQFSDLQTGRLHGESFFVFGNELGQFFLRYPETERTIQARQTVSASGSSFYLQQSGENEALFLYLSAAGLQLSVEDTHKTMQNRHEKTSKPGDQFFSVGKGCFGRLQPDKKQLSLFTGQGRQRSDFRFSATVPAVVLADKPARFVTADESTVYLFEYSLE